MTIILMAITMMALAGCNEETTRYIEIDRAPAIPQGVYSVTGDGEVFISWLHVQDEDLSHYNVWWSPDDNTFELVGSTEENFFVDNDVDNGTTYFYAVSAVDNAGNESELSMETVFDTPRPEGENLILLDRYTNCALSGFDFSTQTIVACDSTVADIYIDYDIGLGSFFLNVGDTLAALTDIQDMGFTYDFDEIGYAPDTTVGWSDVGWLEIIEGHTYVIWTADDHFAKLRVTNIGFPLVVFQWAYQVDQSNPELARPHHDDNYLDRTIRGTIIK
jgi:hypothetical protein